MKLILASTSVARNAMLEAAGVPFEAVSPRIDERRVEDDLHDIAPATLAATLAQKKALAIDAVPGTFVLGSDQVLEAADGQNWSKPCSREEARAQLVGLRARTHRLISAAAIAEGGNIVWRGSETATLAMRDFSDDYLDAYLDDEWDEVRHCVGAYRIEGSGAQLFESIEGSHFAILGLPLLPILSYLRTRGILPQ